MSDTYQATYDAVRSRITGGDIGQAAEDALRNAFGSADHQIAGVVQEFSLVAHEQRRPSVMYRPVLSIDEGQWCALYGDNLQDGVAGFGKSPSDAMNAFDLAWNKPIPSLEKTRVAL